MTNPISAKGALPPSISPVVDTQTGGLHYTWYVYLQRLQSQIQSGAVGYSNQTPFEGFSIDFPINTTLLFLHPKMALTSGTVVTPKSPTDGNTISIRTTDNIGTLTLQASGNQTVDQGSFALTAGSTATFFYNGALATWYRIN